MSAQQVKRLRPVGAAVDRFKPDEHEHRRVSVDQLAGDLNGFSAVSVSGNWRLVFRIEDEDATDVDLVDYH